MACAGVARSWRGADASVPTLYTSVIRPVGKRADDAGSWMAAEKSTALPSGVKASGSSFDELNVRRFHCPAPSAATVNMSKLP